MMETMRTDRVRCGSLDQLQVTKSSEIDREVLMCRRGLVDNQNFENNIELLNSDDSFRINGVRESSKLDYSRQLRNKVLLDFGTSRAA